MNGQFNQVIEMLDEYSAAVAAQDAERLLALYDDGARVFDTFDRWVFTGATEWGETVRAWLSELRDERLAVAWEDVAIDAVDDLAIVHALVRYSEETLDGNPIRALTNRYTAVLRRDGDGKWHITHEHTSMPVSVKTGGPLERD
ncbi:MAG: YybH family protein [Actinomycetota bacterium]